MSAEAIAKALGGRKVGSAYVARCPAHNDHTPSLALRDGSDGKLLVRCHAGCTQNAVITRLKGNGLWPHKGIGPVRPLVRGEAPTPTTGANDDDAKRTELALAIWAEALPAKETLVEDYLRSRGLRLPESAYLCIRFHPGLRHTSGQIFPAMIALVKHGPTGKPTAIHRTFLRLDGRAKAPVDNPKMMLGPCHGGAVWLAEPTERLMIGEGIENTLTVCQKRDWPAWAALSTSGLKTVVVPDRVKEVLIISDGDDPGEAAARACAARLKRSHLRIQIARPHPGKDFNEMLLEYDSSHEKETK